MLQRKNQKTDGHAVFPVRWLLTAALLLTFTSGCVTTGKFVPDVRTYTVKKIDTPVNIDGKLGDAAWQDAVVVERFMQIHRGSPTTYSPYEQIKAWVLRDDNNLYVAAVIRDPDIIADPELLNEEEEKLFLQGDTFEIFIQPDYTQPTYYEFHVNPLNVQWDARILARAYRTFVDVAEWDSGYETAVEMKGTLNKIDTDEHWTVEMKIPLASLTDKDGKPFPVVNGMWRMAICLYDYAYQYDDGGAHEARKFVSSAKLRQLNFHLRQDFDHVHFE